MTFSPFPYLLYFGGLVALQLYRHVSKPGEATAVRRDVPAAETRREPAEASFGLLSSPWLYAALSVGALFWWKIATLA